MVKRKIFSAGLLSASCILFFACTGDSGTSSSKSLVSCSAKVDAVTFTCVEMSETDAANYLTEASCADVVGTSLNYGFSTGCESGATVSCPVTIGNKTATVYLYSEGATCDGVSAEDYLPVLLSSSSDALSSSSEE